MDINYKASPTAAKFHASNAIVRGFMGPVGNGKSVACINELHRIAVNQAPNYQGIRKTKFAIVRNTYDMLETTTLATCKQWLPEPICTYSLKPMRGHLSYQLEDGTLVESELIFLALDRPDDVKKLLSLEVTLVFANEAKELPYAVLKGARERVGRYPSQIDGYTDVYDDDGNLIYSAPRDKEGNYQPCTRKGVIMDTNPPDDSHWWYQLAEEGCLKGNQSPEAKKEVSRVFEFFRGPPPLLKEGSSYKPNPEAENIAYLPGGYQYYFDMIAGNTEDHINVMVLGNYGTIRDGKPVYPQYNDRLHCSERTLGLIEDLPIGLGWDGGLTPACVVGQLTSTGQLRVIAEMFSEDMDVRTFARDVVKPWLARNAQGIEVAFSVIDPTGNNRGEGIGKSAMAILNDDFVDDDGITMEPLELGFRTQPARTNDPTKRIDAVARFMVKLINGEPGYLLSKACTMLRKAKLGAYQYKRIQTNGERYRDKPDKGLYSHISDAEQYLALEFGDYSYDDGYEENRSYDRYDNAMGY